jgi:hypothetical protein
VALAAAGDCRGLARLRRHAAGRGDSVFSTTVAPLAQALICLIHGDADQAAVELLALQGVEHLGGSAAQREIIQETLLFSSTEAGQFDVARSVLVQRLDRRPSPRDSRRMQELSREHEPARLPQRASAADVKGQDRSA